MTTRWSFPIIASIPFIDFSWLDMSLLWGRVGITNMTNVTWLDMWSLNRHRPFLRHYRGYTVEEQYNIE
jgi:hypothetical protein